VHSLESSFSVDRELLPEGQTTFRPDPVPAPTTTTTLPPGPAGSQPPQVLRQEPRGHSGVTRPDPSATSRTTTP
jgi:hypothetical protein